MKDYYKLKTKEAKAAWFLSKKISAQQKSFWDKRNKDFIERWVTTVGGIVVAMAKRQFKFKTREEAIKHGQRYKEMCRGVVAAAKN